MKPHYIELLPLTRAHCVESCRFALAPIATSAHEVLDPEPVSTWAHILDNAHKLSTNCLAKRLGGGVVFIAGKKEIPHQSD